MTERPVECSQCQKPIKVIYKEVSGETTLCSEMCNDCPILEERLHGCYTEPSAQPGTRDDSKLSCAHCQTTLESVKTGNAIGCSHCYTAFGEVLIDELLSQKKIFRKDLLLEAWEKEPYIPLLDENLRSLQNNLDKALESENYEKAAAIRDQIKQLEDHDKPT